MLGGQIQDGRLRHVAARGVPLHLIDHTRRSWKRSLRRVAAQDGGISEHHGHAGSSQGIVGQQKQADLGADARRIAHGQRNNLASRHVGFLTPPKLTRRAHQAVSRGTAIAVTTTLADTKSVADWAADS